jgi:putative flavoprotein involved in K+ transport
MKASVVVIGAGHAGLSMSRRLTERGIDHVVLERGEVANSWRFERWDSLRLLTPNWLCRLPGMRYQGEDPDGFMSASDLADVLTGYAAATAAPVRTHTKVVGVRGANRGYEVATDAGTWSADAVVLASGACNVAAIPDVAQAVPASISMLTPMTYRTPRQLAPGGVLVVGASATGIQLADEIHASGRAVTLAVGEHVRLPRCYRGRDIFWWLDASGILDERHDQIDDLVRARHLPSPQLVGSREGRSIDLNALTDRGVRLVGRLGRVRGDRAQFSGGLANVCALADLKMARLLDTLDAWARSAGIDGIGPPERAANTRVPATPRLELDLGDEGIRTIVWATGYRPDHSWLDVPVLDHRGRIRHDGGIVREAPGMVLLGMNVLRRRRSSFIHGSEQDTDELAAHLHRHLDRSSASHLRGVGMRW